MTDFSRGDVVLVTFIFADESGGKRRPAVVVSSESYNKGREEVVIAAITSNIGRILQGDFVIGEWRGAGLLFPSVCTGIIRTIKATMIDRRLGSMGFRDMESIASKLRLIVGLS